jgi:hypothetical protein
LQRKLLGELDRDFARGGMSNETLLARVSGIEDQMRASLLNREVFLNEGDRLAWAKRNGG